jgi:MFS family permease
MTLFPVSIMTLFWKHEIGMTMTEILGVQALFGLTMVLFEFPSGYLADRIGYRRTLIIASVLSILGWSIYSFANSILTIIAAEAVLGVSIAMASGCDSALLYETLKELGDERDFATWTGRVRFIGQSSEGTAALGAGLLFVWAPWAPFAAQVVVWLVALWLSIALVEPDRPMPERANHWQQVVEMLRHALLDNRRLTAVFALTIVLGMAAFVPVWLVPLYATNAGLDPSWIGPMWAVANYSVAIGALYSQRISLSIGLMPTLLACIALIAIGYTGLALSYGVFGFAWYFCLTAMRGAFGPALHHEENRLIPSSDRAGYLSLRSLLFRLLFVAVGPAVGLGVDAHGQHVVLAVLGLGMTASAAAAWLWLRATSNRVG